MQYLKTQTILFLYGFLDSLQFMKGVKHYTQGNAQCLQIRQHVKEAILFASKKLLIIFGIDIIILGLKYFSIPFIIPLIFSLFQILLFFENNLRQLIYVGKISQTAISYEVDTKQNRQFLIYNLRREADTGFKTILDQIKLTMQALLFSFLLLVQTSIFDILVLILPSNSILTTFITHIDYILYSVYITVGFISLKIPYQDHLPYYLHLYIGYLIGYSLIISYFLNIFFAFPRLGIVFSIIQPISILRAFQIDAPMISEIEKYSFSENCSILLQEFLGEKGLDRNSYEQHLKLAENDRYYKNKLKKTIGWFTLARGVRPYVINPLNNGIVLFLKIYNSLLGL